MTESRTAETQTTELIDTAIVIKNIPFGYHEEDFVNKLFPQLGLTPPYAFNYHRNKSDHAFHGLAFANFNASHEAQAAVDVLNNFELDRRRLRVELKKRLPAEEEQRQRLARQSRRQIPNESIPISTDTSRTPTATSHSQPLESMPMSGDILDPLLRPRIVYQQEPSTPNPSTGMFS
jgi:RNA recognition motif-containing protein